MNSSAPPSSKQFTTADLTAALTEQDTPDSLKSPRASRASDTHAALEGEHILFPFCSRWIFKLVIFDIAFHLASPLRHPQDIVPCKSHFQKPKKHIGKNRTGNWTYFCAELQKSSLRFAPPCPFNPFAQFFQASTKWIRLHLQARNNLPLQI